MSVRLRASIVAFALFGVTCVGACAPEPSTAESGASASNAVTVGLTYIPNVQFSPVYVAHDDSLYSNAGVDVTIRHHGSDEGLFTALISGEEDVVIASGDEAMVARDSGMDLVSIGTYYRQYPGVVIVPADSEIQTLSDLKGHSIGIPGEYGSNWYATLSAIFQGGLSEKDVEIASIGYTQRAALAQGEVDAGLGFSNNDLVQMLQSGMDVRAISLESQTPLVAASIITTRQWAEANPELASAVVSATTAGINSVIDDPDHALDVTMAWDETLSDETSKSNAMAVLQATIPLMMNAGGPAVARQDLDRWEMMAEFLGSVPGVVSQKPDASLAATNEYVNE